MFSFLLHRRRCNRNFNGRFLTATTFKKVLQRERMRVDRSGLRFAVLTIRAKTGEDHPQAMSQASDRIAQRIRETDVAGRLGGELAVLLLNADSQGARTVADDILQDALQATLECQILLYPSDFHDHASDNDSRDDRRHRHAEMAEVASAEPVLAQATPPWKRLIDVVGSSFGLIALMPLLVLVAILVKATSKGPVIYRQRRMGMAGRTFTIFKFRTMQHDAEQMQAALRAGSEQDGPAFKIKNDPRITPIGRILRKTCIDELPQLWNVLRGDMSLVGPRPLPVVEARQCERWSSRRHDVAPGLTCIWQASRHGKTIPFDEWMRMDLSYIRQRSPRRDLGLIFRTVAAVLSARASH